MATQVGRPLPAADSREAQARREVGHTTVSPWTARALTALFLAAIGLVPALEWAGARTRMMEGAVGAWARIAGLPGDVSAAFAGADGRAWTRTVAANRTALAGLHAFEDALEEESALGRLLRPPAQVLLSGWLGAGNERAYVGRDGWLFYRPDVEYVTGRGFLAPAQLARRVAAASEWTAPPQPDPRPAIRRFKQDLDARGIALVLMPTPVKPTVHPEPLAPSSAARTEPLHNPSYAAFIEELRREGLLVFDPSQALVDARRLSGRAQYLATDTHWTPEAMQHVAELLGAFLAAHVRLPPPAADPGYAADPREVSHTGDIALMLDLPAGQTLFPPETVRIRRVLRAGGAPWQTSREADVLLLGDSFTNIYSLGSMGWGEAAGLAEQLSYTLGRPLDRIVQNDAGAHATRAMLRRSLAAGADRLAGKRVVIYQFAARELAFGDWKVLGSDLEFFPAP